MADRASLFSALPSVRTWPHKDGGRGVDVFTATWKLTVVWSARRRDRYGVLQPFYVTLNRWPQLAQGNENA